MGETNDYLNNAKANGEFDGEFFNHADDYTNVNKKVRCCGITRTGPRKNKQCKNMFYPTFTGAMLCHWHEELFQYELENDNLKPAQWLYFADLLDIYCEQWRYFADLLDIYCDYDD